MVAPAAREFTIPEEKAVLMIEACANSIFAASTIPDVVRVIQQADAISAVMRKIKASEEVRKTAAFLLIQAERQLGEVSAKVPTANRNKWSESKGAVVNPNGPSKRRYLESQGITYNRALRAETLAKKPIEEVKEAFSKTKAGSIKETQVKLGIRSDWDGPSPAARLAIDAVRLLSDCAKSQRVPRRDEVNALELRLVGLRIEAKGAEWHVDGQLKKAKVTK